MVLVESANFWIKVAGDILMTAVVVIPVLWGLQYLKADNWRHIKTLRIAQVLVVIVGVGWLAAKIDTQLDARHSPSNGLMQLTPSGKLSEY